MLAVKKKAILPVIAVFVVLTMVSGCFLPVPGFRENDDDGTTSQTSSSQPDSPKRNKKGVYHTVRRGETVYRLSKRYDISQDEIIEANDIKDVTKVRAGERLLIPGTDKVVNEPGGRGRSSGKDTSPGAPSRPPRNVSAECPTDAIKFIWPAEGQLTSGFGIRNERQHDGIDIDNDIGTPIHAAADGVVIYAGRLGGYGLIVILKHEGRFKTIYAHNRKITVKKGDTVRQGDVVAELGNSGNTTGPHLHFEIRCGQEAVDPMPYLPSR